MLKVRHQWSSQQEAKLIEISAQTMLPFLTMLIYLKTFNKSNPVILLDFRWGEGPGSGLVSVGHLGSHVLSNGAVEQL